MKRLIIVALVLVGLWCGWWVVASVGLKRGIEAWLDDRRADGWVAEASDVSVGGFPYRFDTRFRDLSLADPDTGLAWSLPVFDLTALAYQPAHVIAFWPDSQTFRTPDERLEITSDTFEGSVVLVPGPDLALREMRLVLADLAVASDAGYDTGMADGQVAVARLDEAAPNTYRLGAHATDVLVADPVRQALDPAGALPDLLALLNLDARVTFDAPWDRHAVEDRRPQPVAIDLTDLTANWGDLELRAAGELQIDPDGVADGLITVKAVNWREILGLAVAAGAVPEGMAGTIESGLGFLARLSGPPETLDAPLTFSGGRISLGPVPLGAAPVFRLR